MQIVINGVGGQGVLFLSKILCSVALSKSMKIQSSETIGMAQRGGSVISFLKIGDNYHSPMIIPGSGDILICLHEQELENGKQYIKDNGFIYINSDNCFNANKLALKENVPSMANIIFLGFLAKMEGFPFDKNDILSVLPDKKTEKFFLLGYNSK